MFDCPLMKMALALLAGYAVLAQPVVESQTAQRPQPLSAYEAARVRTTIRTIESMLPQVRDRGAALYLLARRYAQLGEDEKALQLLEQCIPLDEGFDPSAASAFARLSSNSAFKALAERARRRFPAVHRAHVAKEIPPNDLFAEGLAVDSERRLFYMGLRIERKEPLQDQRSRRSNCSLLR